MQIRTYSGLTESFFRTSDWIFILRPTVLFTYWTMILCGAGLSGSLEKISFWEILWITLAMAMTNLLNMMNDIETDKLNQKLPWLYENLITPKMVWIAITILTIVPLVGLYFQSSFTVFWISAVALVGILGFMYNVGPIPLKGLPNVSLFMMAIIGVGLWVVGAVLTTELNLINWWSLIGYTSAWTAVCLISMIPDIEGDRATGKITFAVHYGPKATSAVATAMVMITLVDTIIRRDYVLMAPAVVSLPFFIMSLINYSYKWVNLAGKSSVFVLSIAVGIFYSYLYILLIALYFPIAKLYHKARLGMDYPTLVKE